MQEESIFDDLRFEAKPALQDNIKVVLLILLQLTILYFAARTAYIFTHPPLITNANGHLVKGATPVVRPLMFAIIAVGVLFGLLKKKIIGWVVSTAIFEAILVGVVWINIAANFKRPPFVIVDTIAFMIATIGIALMNSRSLKRFYNVDIKGKLMVGNVIALVSAISYYVVLQLSAIW